MALICLSTWSNSPSWTFHLYSIQWRLKKHSTLPKHIQSQTTRYISETAIQRHGFDCIHRRRHQSGSNTWKPGRPSAKKTCVSGRSLRDQSKYTARPQNGLDSRWEWDTISLATYGFCLMKGTLEWVWDDWLLGLFNHWRIWGQGFL